MGRQDDLRKFIGLNYIKNNTICFHKNKIQW